MLAAVLSALMTFFVVSMLVALHLEGWKRFYRMGPNDAPVFSYTIVVLLSDYIVAFLGGILCRKLEGGIQGGIFLSGWMFILSVLTMIVESEMKKEPKWYQLMRSIGCPILLLLGDLMTFT